MTQLVLTAQIQAKRDKVAEVEEVLRGLIEPTRAEDGCIVYDLHLNNEDNTMYVFIETWASTQAWQAHMQSPHMQAFNARTDDLVEDWKLFQLTKLA